MFGSTNSIERTMIRQDRQAQSGITESLTALLNEIYKSLLHAWAARKGMMVEMPLFILFYFALNMYMGRGEIRQELLAPTLIGFTAILFFHQQINRIFWGVLGEIQTGTMEQLYLSPLPAFVLVLGRQVATVLESIVIALLLYLAATLVTGVLIPLNLMALVPLMAIIVASAGFSLIVAGLTLLFKRIELLPELLFMIAFIVGGVFLPLNRLPNWIAVAARLVFPTTQGIEVLREILLQGHSLSALQVDWGLGWLLVQPMLFVVVGAIFFSFSERIAKRNGVLGRY